MTSADLDNMLCRLEPAECVSFFANMGEPDRKALSERALRWFEIADASRIASSPTVKSFAIAQVELPKRAQRALTLLKEVKDSEIPNKARHEKAYVVAGLAVLATCGLTEARKVGVPSLEHSIQLLKDRNPKWFGKWMDLACERHPIGTWNLVRQIERAGIAEAERDSSYWTSMAFSLGQLEAQELIATIRGDQHIPESLLWDMFDCDDAINLLIDPSKLIKEVRVPNFWDDDFMTWRNLSGNLESARRASYIWKSALIELTQTNEVDRQRLLEKVFNWIARLSADGESKASLSMAGESRPVTWFHTVVDELHLTESERQDLIPRYIGLLSTKDSATLTWSLAKLHSYDEAVIPLPDLIGNIGNVFFVKRKDPAVAALKLLEKLLRQTGARELVAPAVLEAFEHTSSDVHKRALSLIKKGKLEEIPGFAESLNEKLLSASALIREQAKRADAATTAAGASQADIEPRLETLYDEISAVPADLSEAAELASTVELIRAEQLPRSLDLRDEAIPRLNPTAPFQPLKSLDDVVFLFAQILEGKYSSEEVELLLDGIMRHCSQRPADFSARVSSVRKRIASILGEGREGVAPLSYFFQGVSVTVDLAEVGRAWIDADGSRAKQPPDIVKPFLDLLGNALKSSVGMSTSPLQFFSERARTVARLASKGVSVPLLSTPTHAGGWIDPRLVPGRIAAWRAAGQSLDKADLIQAMLRLAPQGRDEALAQLPESKEEGIAALRWALGANPPNSMSTAELWVAAFRSREPHGSSPLLAQRFPGLGPDCAEPGAYRECLKEYGQRDASMFGTVFGNQNSGLILVSDPPMKQRAGLKFFPTELLHCSNIAWDASPILDMYWPLNPERFLAYEARRMSLYVESQGSYWQNSWQILFDPDTPVSGYGSWLIALGMAAKQQEVARLSIDALIASIDDGRLSATTFGITLGKLHSTGKLTLSRWINGLKDIKRISNMHRAFVFQSLQYAIAFLEENTDTIEKPVSLPLIELMYECCCEGSEAVELESARKALSKIGGKGKGAKLAKLLLERPCQQSPSAKKAYVADVLAARLERARRWQQWRNSMCATISAV